MNSLRYFAYIYSNDADQPNPTYTEQLRDFYAFGVSNYGEYSFWQENSNGGNFQYINAQGIISNVQVFNGAKVQNTVNL